MVLGFEEYILETDNIYDLIGNCFGLLCDNISNQQAFIGEYMSEGNGVTNNPNLEQLNNFSQEIVRIVSEYEPSGYFEIREQIIECIRQLEIEAYLDDLQNRLTVIYCILTAIDAQAIVWKTKWMQAKLGPLDTNGKTAYRVYFSPRETMHEKFVEGVARKRVSASDFFESFTCFRFIDERRWKEPNAVPQVKFVRTLQLNREMNQGMESLKVAVIPVSCEKHFEFEGTQGSGLRVKYITDVQEKIGNKICGCIELAIQQGANIIILPEYTVSSCILEKVRICLREMYRKTRGKEKLLLVFAGSTWTDDDNNVMRILDAFGNIIGEYYKYSPFTKEAKGKYSFSQYEALANPGRKCDVIGIEQVGMILPAICRDIIDGEYTEEVAKMLLPMFVAIAAWSPSVASFEPRLKELANKYFASTVLCNACSAVELKKEKIGVGSIVSKKKTIVGSEIVEMERSDCISTCKNRECVYFLEYNFDFEPKVKNTQLKCNKNDSSYQK